VSERINNKDKKKVGLMRRMKSLLQRNRLGELLVMNGVLSPAQLRDALVLQKQMQRPLGRVLVEQNIVSRSVIYSMLTQQWSLRVLTLSVGVFITMATFGTKTARAGAIKDVAAQISLVSQANPAFTTNVSYPKIFGSSEKSSSNVSPFTKWTGMFERFDRAINDPQGQKVVSAWQNQIRGFKGLPLEDMVRQVNSFINEQPYILDQNNWGKSDYWSTPVEFFQRGGDCEDFAIAKYASLRALGVPEERMRIAIVHDLEKDIPHAILIVYTDSGAMILDNQNKRALNAEYVDNYRPIFSINRQAWWLHTAPDANTRVASAR
jgi:predicted transglutaminase-like cysteine proteinase